MALKIGVAEVEEFTPNAADAYRTMLQITANANHPLKILDWGVFPEGDTPTSKPIRLRLVYQDILLPGSPASITLRKINTDIAGTFAASAVKGNNDEASVVNTQIVIASTHPQAAYQQPFPITQEVIVPGGARIGVQVHCPATTVLLRGFVKFEE